MFKVAICDDDVTVRKELRNIVDEFKETSQEAVEWEVFDSGEVLWQELVAGKKFDLLFLDFAMPKLNGIQLGKKIREELNDQTTEIVFVTGWREKALEAYEARPRNFLLKPVDKEKVLTMLSEIMVIAEKDKRYFHLHTGRVAYKLRYRDILYFYSRGRKVYVVTAQNQATEPYSYYNKLDDVVAELPVDDFIRIHKSYTVNYRYIAEFRTATITLTNGEVLPISESYQKIVSEALIKIHQARK